MPQESDWKRFAHLISFYQVLDFFYFMPKACAKVVRCNSILDLFLMFLELFVFEACIKSTWFILVFLLFNFYLFLLLVLNLFFNICLIWGCILATAISSCLLVYKLRNIYFIALKWKIFIILSFFLNEFIFILATTVIWLIISWAFRVIHKLVGKIWEGLFFYVLNLLKLRLSYL